LNSISGKCTVLTFQQYERDGSVKTLHDNVFVSRKRYDPTTRRFTPLNEYKFIRKPITLRSGKPIEKILGIMKRTGNRDSLLVKWSGCEVFQNSWIDRRELLTEHPDCPLLPLTVKLPLSFQVIQRHSHNFTIRYKQKNLLRISGTLQRW